MSISTRLEIWREKVPFHPLLRLLSLPTDYPERNLISCWRKDIDLWTFPDPFQGYLEQLERLWPKLDQLGLDRDRISMWIEAECNGEPTAFRLEALTLLSLAQEDIRLCLHFLEGMPSSPAIGQEMRLVSIRDIALDVSGADSEVGAVTVGLDDGSLWSATMYGFDRVREWMNHPPRPGFIWKPFGFMAPEVSQLEAERAVVGLLLENQFERAFERLDVHEPEIEVPSRELTLRMTHGQKMAREVEAILGPGHAPEESTDLLWSFREENPGASSAGDQLIARVESQFQALAKLGIRRTDLTLGWKEVFLREANIDLSPEWLRRMGKNGLSLDFTARPTAFQVIRTLEE